MNRKNTILTILVNVCRCLLAVTFLFSGFVKANDPLGTLYKLQDYLTVWGISFIPDTMILMAAIAIAFFEFTLGCYLALGKRRKTISRIALYFMVVMTLLTVYIAIYNPVTDCGCFGDAIVLTNTQTLLKNIVLLAAAVIISISPQSMKHMMTPRFDWIVTTIMMVGILVYSIYSVYALPTIDFRPYKIGTNLADAVSGDGDSQMQFDVKLVYEKDGRQIELGLEDDDPDSTWNYVETKRTPISSGVKPIINLYVENDGEDITSDIITDEGDLFLLIAPDLAAADQSAIDEIEEIYEYISTLENAELYMITASNMDEQEKWIDYTGAEYLIYTSDERILKTVVRANPGLVRLHNGVITHKWSNWTLPSVEQLEAIRKIQD